MYLKHSYISDYLFQVDKNEKRRKNRWAYTFSNGEWTYKIYGTNAFGLIHVSAIELSSIWSKHLLQSYFRHEAQWKTKRLTL